MHRLRDPACTAGSTHERTWRRPGRRCPSRPTPSPAPTWSATPAPAATSTRSTGPTGSPPRSACPASSRTACSRSPWPPAPWTPGPAAPAGCVELGCKFTKPVVVPDDDDRCRGRRARHRQERHRRRASRSRSRSPAAARRCSACPRRSCVPELARRPHHPAARRSRPRARARHHRGRAARTPYARADASGRPLLLVAGGSNLVVDDDGFEGTVVRIETTGIDRRAGHVRRRGRHGRGGRALGRRSSPRAVERGLGRARGAVRHPGQRRRHPDPERRRLRPGGRRHHRLGALLGPRRRACSAPSSAPTAASATAPAASSTTRTATSCSRVTFQLRLGDLSAPVRYAELARTLGVEPGARAPMTDGARGGARAAPRQGHGARRRPTTTPGAPGRSSPTRSSTTPRRSPTARPAWEQPDGTVKTSAAWLIEHAGFEKGYGDDRVVAVDQAHARPHQPRRPPAPGTCSPSPTRSSAACTTRFGVWLVNEPTLVGCSLPQP